ncbi:MAG: hypothetical protein WC976_06005 [Caldisericia bacterium]
MSTVKYVVTKITRAFKKLSSRERWDMSKKLKNVVWCCENCGCVVDRGWRPRPEFMGERYCGNCDSLLTRRTNGGQNDPFNFLPKEIKK